MLARKSPLKAEQSLHCSSLGMDPQKPP